MPTITIPRSAPIGSLRALTQSDELAPRPDVVTGLSSTKATGYDAQAINANVAGATELSQLGASEAALSQELIKPFEALRQSREAMQATDISNTAILAARSRVAAVTSSGAPYEQWLPLVAGDVDALFAEARGRAGQVSSIAQANVERELQGEKLRLLSGVVSASVKEELDFQSQAYQKDKELATQDYFSTSDLERRKEIRKRVERNADLLGQTGAVARVAAEKDKQTWLKTIETSEVVEYGTKNGLDNVVEFAKTRPSLDPDEQRIAVNRAQDAISLQLHKKREAEVLATKQVKFEQDQKAIVLFQDATDPKKSIAEYEKIIDQATALAVTPANGQIPLGRITDEHARGIITAARKSINDKLFPSETKNPRRAAELGAAIYDDPNSVTDIDIVNEPTLSGEEQRSLMAQRHDRLSVDSFQKRATFKQYMNEIGQAVPETTFATILLNPGAKEALRGIQEEGQTEFLRYMLAASRKTNGVLSEEEVVQLGEVAKERIKKRISEIKLSVVLTNQEKAK